MEGIVIKVAKPRWNNMICTREKRTNMVKFG